eukprot:CAMPEP_0202693664 /NCGR_PEP_ID=MMETSP1385-20130828/7710_1 /ASSEMBLY_ACC=CAM_ASM_000861 /TAXON_ID=933848 /ORGANISM="Elphidium margaritaceum" /LENGTH=343 /DNA_ID=CAMNT_0049349373 /DNA_START=14 /DNA_END=1045 /DNA_ORIENTATION=+
MASFCCGPSASSLIALRNGQGSDGIGEKNSDHEKLNLSWKYPTKIEMSFRTIAGKKPTPVQLAFGKLFCLMSHAVFPFWAYKTSKQGPGCLIIEPHSCGMISSVMKLNSLELVENPSPVCVTFVDTAQLRIFLNSFGENQNVEMNMGRTKQAYQERRNRMGVGMCVLFAAGDEKGRPSTSFSMWGWDSEHSKPYDDEAKAFGDALNQAQLKECHYITLDLKNKSVQGSKIGDVVYPDFLEQKIAEHRNDRNETSGQTNHNIHLQQMVDDVMKNPSRLNTMVKLVEKMKLSSSDESRICGYCGKTKEKMLRCSKCKAVYYCSAMCQRPHWKQHKKTCKTVDGAK